MCRLQSRVSLLVCVVCIAHAGAAGESPAIDGSLSEPFWQKYARVWHVREPALPDNSATFYLSYDDTYLYLAADVVDRNICGLRTLRRDQTWRDDAVTLLIAFENTDANESGSFLYEFSAAGGVRWHRDLDPGHITSAQPAQWNSAVDWAVLIRGGSSLNFGEDRDLGWRVEARIPWTELGQEPPGPQNADRRVGICFLNFCRPEQEDLHDDQPLASVPGFTLAEAHQPNTWEWTRLAHKAALPVRGMAISGDRFLDGGDGMQQTLQRAKAMGLNQLLIGAPCAAAAVDPGPIELPTALTGDLGLSVLRYDAPAGSVTKVGGLTLYPLQGCQWFLPEIDPQIRIAASVPSSQPASGREGGDIAVIGGPTGALSYLFWGDPQWMCELGWSLRRHGLDGMVYASQPTDDWLALESFGRYAGADDPRYDASVWTTRLSQTYGLDDAEAGRLLTAMQQASGIMPQLLTLVHDRSPRYMPQFGLLTCDIIGLPTISTWTDDQSQHGGWGLDVAPISSIGETSYAGLSPQQIAVDLHQKAAACLSAVEALHEAIVQPDGEQTDLARLLNRLALNARLGLYFHHKIQAAIDWDDFKRHGGRSSGLLRGLDESVETWRSVATTAEALYPEVVPYWELRVAAPPPWTPEQIRDGYAHVTGHWRDRLKVFEKERDVIRRRVREHHRDAVLPTAGDLAID